MRTIQSSFVMIVLGVAVLACGGSEGESALQKSLPPPTKKLSDVKQGSATDKSPEELAEARKQAGFKSRDELAAENASAFEKGAREYVKTRMKDYRGLITDLRNSFERLEKESAKWAETKDPSKAFAKFEGKFKEDAKTLTKRYDEITGHGVEGGNTQVVLGKAFRAWEELANGLDPQIGKQEAFKQTLTDARKSLDEVVKALDEIEKDETLVTNKFQAGKEAKEEGAGESDPQAKANPSPSKGSPKKKGG